MDSSSIWFDNWNRLGALYHVVEPDFEIEKENGDIDSLMTEDMWDMQKLKGLFSEDIIEHIVKYYHK